LERGIRKETDFSRSSAAKTSQRGRRGENATQKRAAECGKRKGENQKKRGAEGEGKSFRSIPCREDGGWRPAKRKNDSWVLRLFQEKRKDFKRRRRKKSGERFVHYNYIRSAAGEAPSRRATHQRCGRETVRALACGKTALALRALQKRFPGRINALGGTRRRHPCAKRQARSISCRPCDKRLKNRKPCREAESPN